MCHNVLLQVSQCLMTGKTNVNVSLIKDVDLVYGPSLVHYDSLRAFPSRIYFGATVVQ